MWPKASPTPLLNLIPSPRPESLRGSLPPFHTPPNTPVPQIICPHSLLHRDQQLLPSPSSWLPWGLSHSSRSLNLHISHCPVPKVRQTQQLLLLHGPPHHLQPTPSYTPLVLWGLGYSFPGGWIAQPAPPIPPPLNSSDRQAPHQHPHPYTSCPQAQVSWFPARVQSMAGPLPKMSVFGSQGS